ncbi:MAG: hypothetical protein NC081_05395 [Roseburia sp.]|nr:hypothetical protein [Lachnospiraceae bacterium]MCM1568867.1 hypothetical protein [Roseburia sp.]
MTTFDEHDPLYILARTYEWNEEFDGDVKDRFRRIRMGTLYLDGDVCEYPHDIDGIQGFFGERSIRIGKTSPNDYPLIWIQPHKRNILISNRVLLNCISWQTLKESGYVKGRPVTLHGQKFICRLLDIGSDESLSDEWGSIVSAIGDTFFALPDFEDVASWGINVSSHSSDKRALIGGAKDRLWGEQLSTYDGDDVGFRPVLIPVKLKPSWLDTIFELDNTQFKLSQAATEIELGDRPMLTPAQIDSNPFAGISDGTEFKAYTLLLNGSPVPMDSHAPILYSKADSFVLSDKFYDTACIIPWRLEGKCAVLQKTFLCQEDKSLWIKGDESWERDGFKQYFGHSDS